MIKLTNLLKETLTEISVEQLKTQFVDSGKISQEDFNNIINTTPKTAYITWLAKKVADELIEVEDIYKYKKYFNIFDRRKREYPFTDINQYKTQDDLSQFIDKSIDIANKESEDASQQKGVSKTDKYKEFYLGSVNGFNVYEIPKGRQDLYGTSCELGSGTEWCTATGNTRQHFDKYNADGPLFIFINPSTKEKYQFNYENEQFMDKNDARIRGEDKKALFDFIKNIYPKYEPPYDIIIKNFPEEISLNILTRHFGEELGIIVFKLINSPNELTKDELDLRKYNTLFFTDLPITTLPNNFKVRTLFLSRSNILSLPSDLQARQLFIGGTPLSKMHSKDEIKTMLPNVETILYLL
jgi:hypothetical protein